MVYRTAVTAARIRQDDLVADALPALAFLAFLVLVAVVLPYFFALTDAPRTWPRRWGWIGIDLVVGAWIVLMAVAQGVVR
jgi:hypothetical protein